MRYLEGVPLVLSSLDIDHHPTLRLAMKEAQAAMGAVVPRRKPRAAGE